MESRKRPSSNEDGSLNEKLDKLAEDIKKLPNRRKELLADLMKKRLYDSVEASELLGISIPSLRRAIKLGRLRAVHVGRFLRIPAEEIQKLLEGEEGLLTTEEAGKLLNVSPLTIRSLINSGKIKACRLSGEGRFKILKSEIERIATGGITKEND
jgi:excisionase family DNA binding protein